MRTDLPTCRPADFLRKLLPIVLLAACGPATPPPAGLAESDKAAIEQATKDAETRFNAQPADFRAHANAYYVADAVFMPPNRAEIKGSDNIGNWMATYPAIRNAKFTIVDLDGSGEVAYLRGTYEMDVTAPGMTVAIHDMGKYLEIWRKQADGTWKVVRGIFNSDLAVTMQDTGKRITGKRP